MKDAKAMLKRLERLEKDFEAVKEYLTELIEQQDAQAESTDKSNICPFCKKTLKPTDRVTRGICKGSCYHEARRMVAEGKTTWKALEKANLVLPAGATKPGPKASSKLSKTEIERLEKLASKSSSRKSS